MTKLQLREGAFYVTADGQKIGPIERYRHASDEYVWTYKDGAKLYTDEGRRYFHTPGSLDHLVAEWIDPSLVIPVPMPVAKITASVGGATITIEGTTAAVVRAFMDLPEVDLQGLFLPTMVRNPEFTPPVAVAA